MMHSDVVLYTWSI